MRVALDAAKTRACVCASAVAVLAALGSLSDVHAQASTVHAQASKVKDSLVVDYRTKKVVYFRDGRGSGPYEDGDRIRLRTGIPTIVVLTGVTSSLNSCSLEATPVDAAEIAALRDFAGSLGPFLVDNNLIPLLAVDPTRVTRSVSPAQLDTLVRLIDLYVRPVRVNVQIAVQEMKGMEADSAVKHAKGFIDTLKAHPVEKEWKSYLGCDTTPCKGSKFGPEIARLLFAIYSSDKWFRRELSDAVILELLAHGDELIAIGYDTDKMLSAMLTATTRLECGRDSVSRAKGRALTISVKPSAQPMLARGAVRPLQLRIGATPDWMVRPSLGLAVYYSPDAEFPQFGVTTTDKGQTVFRSGTQDARLLYGITLGITYRGVDRRDANVPWAVWLPELFVKPDDSNRALGAGIGLSLSVLKLGVGYGWVKHTRLVDKALGDTVTAANQLKTEPFYGKKRMYYSLSLIGIPPFLKSSK